MVIHNVPKNGSTHAGAQVGEDARRDLISLSLAPVRQGLRFYAEINRSILDTFFRFIPWGMGPFGALSEQNGLPATKPGATKRAATTKRPAAKPNETKRPATTKRPAAKPSESKRAATTKRSAAAEAVATKRPATNRSQAATKRPATTKAVTSKRAATTKAPATKRPAASKGAANRRPAAPPTPHRATGQSAAQTRAGKPAPKPTVKGAGRVKPSAAKKASGRPRNARASAGKKA